MRNPNQKPLLIAVIGFLLIFLGYFAGRGLEAWVDQKDQQKKQRSVPTSTWVEYKNSVYGYSFKHPEDLPVLNDIGPVPSSQASIVSLGEFEIEVLDPQLYSDPDVVDIYRLPLEEYVDLFWQSNKTQEGTKISAIREVSISGNKGYNFTISGQYTSETAFTTINVPTEYILLSHKGYNYRIHYPSDNERLRTIAETIRFE